MVGILSCRRVFAASRQHADHATGALSSTYLERILVDASHIDQKKRGILDMKETQIPLVQLLTRKELKGRYSESDAKVELLFF